jgi:hypothetical protein
MKLSAADFLPSRLGLDARASGLSGRPQLMR